MKIRRYLIDGYFWYGVTVNGRIHLIRRLGKVGALIHP